MKPASVLMGTVMFGWGVLATAPAQADGPSMQETEQYIVNNYNQYVQPAEVQLYGNVGTYSISVSNCSIVIYYQDGGDSVTTTVQMAKVQRAAASLESDNLSANVAIYAWNALPLFTQDIHVAQFNTDTVTMLTWMGFPFLPDNLVPAERVARAIAHYAQLCGSVDPNKETVDPTDPFSK